MLVNPLFYLCFHIQAVSSTCLLYNNNKINDLTDSFNFKVKMTGQPGDNRTKYVDIMVPLKYISNFGRTLEVLLINCEINLILTWSTNFFIVST